MELSNLGCLHKCGNGMFLEFKMVEDLFKEFKGSKEALEIDTENKKWRYITPGGYIQPKDWSKFGKAETYGDKFVQLVFDITDLEQLEKAFSTASHFYSNKDNRGW